MTTAKKDGRRNNGAAKRMDDQQLIRGPSALLEAMRARAERDGQNVSEAWRRAAELYLGVRSEFERDVTVKELPSIVEHVRKATP